MVETLQRKVAVGIAILVAVVGLAIGLTMLQLARLQDTLGHLTTNTVPSLDANGDFNTAMQKVVGDVTTLVLLKHQDEQADAEEALADAGDALDRLDAIIAAEVAEHGADAERDTRALQEHRRALLTRAEGLLQEVAAGAEPAALVEALEELDDAVGALEPASDELAGQTVAEITETIDQGIGQFTVMEVGLFVVFVLLAICPWFLARRIIVRPLQLLAAANVAVAVGDLTQEVAVTSQDEIGTLQQSFNALTQTLRTQRDKLAQQVTVAREAQATAEAAREQVAAQLVTIQDQHEIIREISVPVLPISDTTLVVPLVGALDTARLRLLQEQVLRAVETTGARVLLLDVTGVPVVDTAVAKGLIEVVRAARLLGADVRLVGIRPEVAQTIVGLGVVFEGINTHASLQSGLQGALQTADQAPGRTRRRSA